MNPPRKVFQTQIEAATKKAALPLGKIIPLGAIAGACIAFGANASSLASSGISDFGLAKLVSAAIFPAGLAMIVLVGAELFTGNCLIWMGWREKKLTLSALTRNLALVWVFNLIGSLAVVALVAFSGQWSCANGAIGAAAIKTAAAKTALSPANQFFSGILCNILVCMAILAAASSKQVAGKVLALWFPIMAFVIGGFEHSVANMYFLPAGWAALHNGTCAEAALRLHGLGTDAVTLSGIAKNLLFVTLGNIVGGMLFVALPYRTANRER